MGTHDRRRHERFQVQLVARFTVAAEFVTQYVDNLSMGGLFIAGARDIDLFQELEVAVELPEHGTWKVRGKVVLVLDDATAMTLGRKPGVGMELTHKPPGYEDALLGYLLRLGRRRDVAVMVGEAFTANAIIDAGYRTIPLVDVAEFTTAVARSPAPVIAVVVASKELVDAYRAAADADGAGAIILAVGDVSEFSSLLARLDSLLD